MMPVGSDPFPAIDVELVARILDEASKNLRGPLSSKEAKDFGIRFALPEEVEASAWSLRNESLGAGWISYIAELLDEAARGLRELILTQEALVLGVRPLLPDELDAAAAMLRESIATTQPSPNPVPGAGAVKRPRP